jgi:hypothetical protein
VDENFDVFCATEINIAWQNLPVANMLHERFRRHFEFAKSIASNNKDKTFTDTFQRGGTLMICQGHTCGRIISTGADTNI